MRVDRYAVVLVSLVLCACEVRTGPLPETRSDVPDHKTAESSVVDQPVQGTVLGQPFKPDQIIVDDNKITFRTGTEFFPDRAVEISVFPEEFPFATDATSDAWMSRADIQLSEKTSGSTLPNNVRPDIATFRLSFGPKGELGVPLEILLETRAPHASRIEGRGYATFDDIRVVGDAVDLQWDSFDTLRHVAKKHVRQAHRGSALNFSDDFGLIMRNPGEGKGSKTAFIGYELEIAGQDSKIVKLQLLKPESGWQVAKGLTQDQIDDAHPLPATAIETAPATVAARALEAHLLREEKIPDVRGTYVSRNVGTATGNCDTRYDIDGIMGLSCRGQNYRMEMKSGEWQVAGKLALDERIDPRNGSIIKQKPSTFGCHGIFSPLTGVGE